MARDSEYEYKTVKITSLRDSKRVSKELVRQGKQGWEIYDKQEGGILFGSARLTFRRKKC